MVSKQRVILPQYDVPNVNQVQDKTEPVKLTEDGKVDPTTIAKAEDFGDWEEETGCRG